MELNRGSAESTLDDKGRVNIPVRFRQYFQGELVITRGMEHYALIMTPAAWENFAQNFINSEMVNPQERLILEDKFLNQAQVVELDKAGRIAIPPTIRKYANLSKDCMIIRVDNRLSVWDSGAFEAYLTENENLARSALNKLGTQDIFKAR
ncbi:MAG: division/cell wall cluster transcriptional repressor MraZ [Treponema sp.]|nr:division/cell wall cluster transcriptional repressor MraZ [Treponema sp.]